MRGTRKDKAARAKAKAKAKAEAKAAREAARKAEAWLELKYRLKGSVPISAGRPGKRTENLRRKRLRAELKAGAGSGDAASVPVKTT